MQYQADFKAMPAEASETFRVVCAWCKKVMRDGQSQKVSHGICNTCFGIVLERGGYENSKATSGTVSSGRSAKN